MPKTRTMYYSNRFNRAAASDGKEPVVFSAAPRRSFGRLAPIIMIGCLLLAVASVLLVPLMVGGAAPASSQAVVTLAATPASVAEYDSVDAAAAAANLPTGCVSSLPDGYILTAARVVDGTVMELDLTGKEDFTLRYAAGTDDLSGADYDALAYTVHEEVDGITRCYGGLSDKKLTLAVWVAGGHTYALLCPNGADAGLMHELAESMA